MTKPANGSKRNLGSLIVSALFIVAGIVTYYDATTYQDLDSKVFPQTVAIVLIIFATISLINELLKPSENEGFGRGDWWRRILLVVTMLLACAAMPYIGFLAAGAISFAGGLIAAMHDRWSTQNIILYWGAGAVVLTAFYAIFRYALSVPLP